MRLRTPLKTAFFAGLVSALALSSALAAPPAAPVPMKEWTFLIFLNGHNNLDRYGALNINQLEKVGSTDQINVVVQWASTKAKNVKRVYVTKDNDFNKVTSPVLQEMGLVDMGNWHNLVEFVKWGHQNFPAKRYFVDVWNHGSGWHTLMMNGDGSQIGINDISFDDFSGHKITTEELGQAMAESAAVVGHKIDLYGSDACLMGMAEIANEMSDSVSHFVGSEEVEPAEGWPYDTFFAAWAAKPTMTPAEVSAALADAYHAYYSDPDVNRDGTMSAFDLTKMDKLNQAIAKLADTIKGLNAADRKKVLQAAGYAINFAYSDYADTGSFLNHLEKAKIEAVGRSGAIDAVRDALKEWITVNRVTDRYTEAQGSAMWLPTYSGTYTTHAARYGKLKFAAATKWDDAIKAYLSGN